MNTTVASYWGKVQSALFPGFAEELGSTTDKHLKVIVVLDIVKLEDHLDIDPYALGPGRPRLDATAMARAFVAKAVLNTPTSRALIDRLNADAVLRRICGFERKAHVPCEASFSNWFARFARISFPEKGMKPWCEKRTIRKGGLTSFGHCARLASASLGNETLGVSGFVPARP
jgi:hypothetical protein